MTQENEDFNLNFPDEYYELGNVLSKEEKQKFIQDVMQPVLAATMNIFLTCGIENYIELMAINDATKQEYILTFQTKESYEKRLIIPEQAPETSY